MSSNPDYKPSDAVNPSHYHGTTVDDFIEEFKLGFRLGNAIKYIARHQEKGTPLQDLEKAAWYLNREIERMKLKASRKPLLDASCAKHQWFGRNDETCPGCKP